MGSMCRVGSPRLGFVIPTRARGSNGLIRPYSATASRSVSRRPLPDERYEAAGVGGVGSVQRIHPHEQPFLVVRTQQLRADERR
jgi:hypothetical protein